MSLKAAFTSVASERKYCIPLLFESDIEQLHAVITLHVLSYVLNEYPKILVFSVAVWELSSKEFKEHVLFECLCVT